MATYEIKAGDLEPSFTANLVQGRGGQLGAIRLHDAVSVRVVMWRHGEDDPFINRDATVLDPDRGRVQMEWQAGDTDVAGRVRAQVIVEWADQRPQSVPSSGFFEFRIGPSWPSGAHAPAVPAAGSDDLLQMARTGAGV